MPHQKERKIKNRPLSSAYPSTPSLGAMGMENARIKINTTNL